MKITFLQNHQSATTGNEYYAKGARADLPKGQALIDSGIARAGWDEVEPEPEPESEPIITEAEHVPLADRTKAELIDLAKEAGIAYSGLTKDALIDALEEAD